MNEEKRTLVMRGETKYLEQRVERIRATGFVDDVYTRIVELEDKRLTKRTIRVYDISTRTNVKIPERFFHYGESFRDLQWKRNCKIEFDGTVYKLGKCKGKNDQKSGSKEILEIRNPRNIEVVELETNKRYRPPRANRSSSKTRTEKSRRETLRNLVREQETDCAKP